MKTVTLNHEERIKDLLSKNQTIVIVRDNDDEAWQSGWAAYLQENYNYSNLNAAFRVNLEKPKSTVKRFEVTEKSNIMEQRDSDLYLYWENTNRVEFEEYKGERCDELFKDNEVRVMSITSTGCKIQFRAKTPIDQWKKGKPRNMSAIAFVSIEELEHIVATMKSKTY